MPPRCNAIVRVCVVVLCAIGTALALPPELQSRLANMPEAMRLQLLRNDAHWQHADTLERAAIRQRLKQLDALPRPQREQQRQRWQAWQTLPAAEQRRLRDAQQAFAALPASEQAALRAEFNALDATARAGWLLGPGIGKEWPRLQLLLQYLPAPERTAALTQLQAMTPRQRSDLGVLAWRTPPPQRATLRRAWLATPISAMDAWLLGELDR